jgi:hypothetical protein
VIGLWDEARGEEGANVATLGPTLLAFLIPGPRELLLVALVALVFYGRGGSRLLMATRYGRWLRMAGVAPKTRPTTTPAAKADAAAGRRDNRLFWALTLLAAVVLAALIVTRASVLHATGSH